MSIDETNLEGHKRLRAKLEGMLGALGLHDRLMHRSLYLGKNIPIGGTAHQAGTVRFGRDPKTSALDVNCKAHDLDNLYVVDASFFVSIAAVNPSEVAAAVDAATAAQEPAPPAAGRRGGSPAAES